jgi:hypothetical protein
VDKVRLGQVSLEVLLFSPLIIPTLLHTHLSPPHAVCDSPDQATHYQALGPKSGASFLAQHLAGLGVKVVSCGAGSATCGPWADVALVTFLCFPSHDFGISQWEKCKIFVLLRRTL